MEVSNTQEKVAEDNLLDLFEFDIESAEFKGWIKNVVKKVKDFGKKVVDKVKSGINYLKQKGYWSLIVNALKSAGKIAATSVCSAYLSPAVCGITFCKDLSKIGRDLSRTIIVDNLADNYKLQPNNGIPILNS